MSISGFSAGTSPEYDIPGISGIPGIPEDDETPGSSGDCGDSGDSGDCDNSDDSESSGRSDDCKYQLYSESSDTLGVSDKPSHRGEDLNVKLLGSIIRYTEENYGRDTASRILDSTGLSMEDLSGPRYWVSHAQFEKVLSSCRALFEDDEEFKIACSYKLAESFGPLRYLVRASSVGATLVHAVRTMHLVSRISRYELVELGPSHIVKRYVSDRSESRLMCLSRISNIEAFATLWGLPKAVVKESSCIADGDDECIYHIKWYERPRRLPALFGALLGGAGSAALLATGGSLLVALMPPVIAALIMHIWELDKVYRRNLEFSEENNKHLRDLDQTYIEALREANELAKRHKDWSRLLEARISRNRRRMEDAFELMGAFISERHSKTARTTHDMGTPLQILSMLRQMLEPHLDPGDENGLKVLAEAVEAADRISMLVRKVMDTPVRPLGVALPMKPESLEVAPLAERFKQRTMAQVIGKDIQVIAYTSRDAPASIHIDHLLFDLIMDSLLTNAAHYTEKGTILIEVDGDEETLAIKISDTGSAVTEEWMHALTETGKNKHREGRRVFGLAMVVSFLDGCSGRLEVISQPGMGATFRVYFPVEAQHVEQHEYSRVLETAQDVIRRVVTFRSKTSVDGNGPGKITLFPKNEPE